MPVLVAANGLQPGVSGDASELRTIGKIELLRENIPKARQIKPLRLTAVSGRSPFKNHVTNVLLSIFAPCTRYLL